MADANLINELTFITVIHTIRLKKTLLTYLYSISLRLLNGVFKLSTKG